jgi:hypothetical protein
LTFIIAREAIPPPGFHGPGIANGPIHSFKIPEQKARGRNTVAIRKQHSLRLGVLFAEIPGACRARRRTPQDCDIEPIMYIFLGDTNRRLRIVINDDDLPRIPGRRMGFEEFRQEEHNAFLVVFDWKDNGNVRKVDRGRADQHFSFPRL